MLIEKVIAYGHKNITAKHKTTLEITKDAEISKRADCIIGVRANKGLADLSEEFKRLARRDDAIIKVVLEVDGIKDVIVGRGSKNLTFEHESDIVIRKSNYICGRTLMIKANKASIDIDERIRKAMQNPEKKLIVYIYVMVEE